MQSRCYARADRLDLNLARQTRGYYIEPENLLTITVPKQICLQRMHFQRGGIRHFRKLSPNELGLSRQNICIRPASWSKNEQNIPNQFPCYGFFGYSTEITDPNDLGHWAVKICTSNLYKIGKGQIPTGLIATCRSPKLSRYSAGRNC
jgi:hypothetical protein